MTTSTRQFANTMLLKGYDTPQEVYDSLDAGTIHVVGMNLTSECNYRCPYCFVGSENLKTAPDEMTTAQKLSALEQANACGGQILIVSGKGEPFSDPAIWAMIEKASSLKMWTIVYTNGSLIKQDRLDELTKANVSLMVKVDSLDPAEYEASIAHSPPRDDIRGWILELRDALPPQVDSSKENVLCRFGINAVLSKANERSIPDVSQFCQREQILFSCRVVQQTGNAIRNWSWLVGEEEGRLNKIAKEYSMRTMSSQAPNGSCSIYRYGVTIENNGNIYMCPNSRMFQNRIGNICEEPLVKLLKRRVEMYPPNPRSGYCFVRASNTSHMKSQITEAES